MMNKKYSILTKALAWGVHTFTASGLLAAFMAILAISNHRWQEAALWLILSLFIDGVDGTLARLVRVREVLPQVDGKTIDYVIDFATYAIIPTYFLFEIGLIEGTWRWIAAGLMLISSALYYGKDGMISDDYYFVGFPVLWNLVVFYQVFVFDFPSWAHVILVIFFTVLHFVPIKVLYPSRIIRFRWLHFPLSFLILANGIGIVLLYPDVPQILIVLAWLSAAYFVYLTVYATWIMRISVKGDG